ncbi:MAG: carbohydrate-binding protein, partial [Chitinophagaceae bacterium]
DKTIALPTSSVYLNGSATDIDGSIVSYAWSKLSGPSQGTIATATAAATNITGLSQGVYIFALRVTDNSGAAATDEVTVTVNSAPTTAPPSGSYTLLPAKMEAENWSNMQGVQTEGTADAGGGFNVGYIDNGDWMDYNVNAPTTGTYTIRFRIASGGRFNILTNGVQIGSAIWENTGGFQTWRIVTTTINLTQGTQTLRILSAGGTPNFNWFEILLPTTPATAYQNSTLYTTEQRVANLSNAAGIRLFPNPVQDRTMVVVNNDHTGEMTARLVGANGAVYKNIRWTKAAKGTQQFSLNIGTLLPGRYLLIIHTKGEKTSIPLIKL